MSSSELSQQGFLPHSLFERLICRLIPSICCHDPTITLDERLVDNDLITGFRGKVQLSYKVCDIRIFERQEENRIEVIVQSRDKDNEIEKKVFIEIYEMIGEMVELSTRECFEGLHVKTLIHLPHTILPISKEEGFITLEKVRWLLSSSDATVFKGSSSDTKCRPTLTAGRMKKDPYWSVWKEKVTIPYLPVNVSSSSIPLREGKKTHVFLSHDWGIDGNNHHRVKQVSEALKSRGLVTWIDDDRGVGGESGIATEIDASIAKAIQETECMLVFVTENYRKKINGDKENDYCKMEFSYGFHRSKKMIPVVLESSMTDREGWDGLLGLYLCRTLHYDLSQIFESSTCKSNKSVEECMEGLFQRIVLIINEGGDNK